MIALALLLAQVDPVAAYAQCLADGARRVDDGKSEAAAIATVIRADCAEVEHVAALFLAGDDAYGNRELIAARIERDGLARAIRAVVNVRAAGAR